MSKRSLVIGATGLVGSAAARGLEAAGHEVLPASRTSSLAVDTTDPNSIEALFAAVGTVDAVVVAAGSGPFKPFPELTRDDYVAALYSKALSQLDVLRIGLDHVTDGGSITLTSGCVGREPTAAGAAAAAANGAVENVVSTAAAEAPRGVRINAVSPNVLASAESLHAGFPGQIPVTDAQVAAGYLRAVDGLYNGDVIVVE